MSRINVDAVALTDPRFSRLAKLLGLADSDHARGKVEHLWLACTHRGESQLPLWLVEQLMGAGSAGALIESELARWVGGRSSGDTRRLHIAGSRERCLWMKTKREQSSKAGRIRAEGAQRVAGRFKPAPAGDVTSAPAPAPAPALKREKALPDGAPNSQAPGLAPTPRRAAQIPDTWTPDTSEANQSAEAEARKRGVNPVLELVKLRDWARSKGIARKDWNAQWRNWMRGARPDFAGGTWNGTKPKQPLRIVAESDEPDLSVYDAIDRRTT